MRKLSKLLVTATAVGMAAGMATAPATAAPKTASPGAPGIGDPYYPLDGNGGYDVAHYDIRLTYRPAGDELSGTTTITAKATQDLSSFNLDFLLELSSLRVNNAPAQYATDGGELTVTRPNRSPRARS